MRFEIDIDAMKYHGTTEYITRIDVRIFVNYEAEDFESNSNWDVYEFLDEERECRSGVGGGGGGSGGNSINGESLNISY